MEKQKQDNSWLTWNGTVKQVLPHSHTAQPLKQAPKVSSAMPSVARSFREQHVANPSFSHLNLFDLLLCKCQANDTLSSTLDACSMQHIWDLYIILNICTCCFHVKHKLVGLLKCVNKGHCARGVHHIIKQTPPNKSAANSNQKYTSQPFAQLVRNVPKQPNILLEQSPCIWETLWMTHGQAVSTRF